MKQARLYNKLSSGNVQCQACAFRCKIKSGDAGICGVRKNVNGKLYLLVWGKAVSVNVDPIEKKPLYHFLPGSNIFSIGTLGCNFSCGFCQNYDISQKSKNEKVTSWGQEISPKTVTELCVKNNIPSIAFTYNEPTIYCEYAVDIMKEARKHNLKGVYVTNGFETRQTLDFIENYIDAYNIDLKSFSEKFYQKICKANLKQVVETIKEVYRRKKWLEITTLLVPQENDSTEEIAEIAIFIKSLSKDIPWHVSAFHPAYKMSNKEVTSQDKLMSAYKTGKDIGLNYIYLGNINSNQHSSTLCPNCCNILIQRNGHQIITNNFKGVCPQCGLKIPGIFTIDQ